MGFSKRGFIQAHRNPAEWRPFSFCLSIFDRLSERLALISQPFRPPRQIKRATAVRRHGGSGHGASQGSRMETGWRMERRLSAPLLFTANLILAEAAEPQL